MRAAKTEQERNNLRLQQHKEMQERARAQGKTLPDMPPADRGPGMGPGGGGMGPGGGMMGPGAGAAATERTGRPAGFSRSLPPARLKRSVAAKP